MYLSKVTSSQDGNVLVVLQAFEMRDNTDGGRDGEQGGREGGRAGEEGEGGSRLGMKLYNNESLYPFIISLLLLLLLHLLLPCFSPSWWSLWKGAGDSANRHVVV